MKDTNQKQEHRILELDDLEYFHAFEGLKAKLVHTDTQTYSFWEIDKGAILPEHSHINEQVSIITKGELEFTIGGKTTLMKPGMVAVIPPNVVHSAIAKTDVEVTDVFLPIRADFPQ